HLLNVDLIRQILQQLTMVVVTVELLAVAVTCGVLGEITMRSRRSEIAIRRLDSARRSRLLRQFLLEIGLLALVAGICGEAAGVLGAVFLDQVTVLPARLTAVSLLV